MARELDAVLGVAIALLVPQAFGGTGGPNWRPSRSERVGRASLLGQGCHPV
jgi:hypothetical protein